jgi:protein-L-isoaspartate(D-aspartate) O-methyltransferase
MNNHPSDREYADRRSEMVADQIEARGIRDARVLEAMRRVPRELCIPPTRRSEAYEDHPVSIGEGQTISQPYMVALMLQTLELTGGERVLEIGTGSGYQTALLAELCEEVFTVERIPTLADHARGVLEEMGYDNVHYGVGDGTLGWPGGGTFDGIVVSAGGPSVPPALEEQLADGGRLVIPVGDQYSQMLLAIRRCGQKLVERTVTSCVFVKLIGKDGWDG